MKKAVVLVSGGLDSATTLAAAVGDGFECYALSFDYGQKHASELIAAKRVADNLGAREHRTITIDLGQFGGSALTDENLAVPEEETEAIPITYVPARNTVFLSYAMAWAEVLAAHDVFIGVNAVDYSGYPDCRPEFISAFQTMAQLATKAGVEGEELTIHTPLIDLTKGQIIQLGLSLGVDYADTVSCYQADPQGRACGLCDSCRIRRDGFAEIDVSDVTRYR